MATKLISHNLDTNGWLEFPFSANGIDFVSKVSPASPLLNQIKALSKATFAKMNQGAIENFDVTGTLNEINEKLIFINENASHIVLELA